MSELKQHFKLTFTAEIVDHDDHWTEDASNIVESLLSGSEFGGLKGASYQCEEVLGLRRSDERIDMMIEAFEANPLSEYRALLAGLKWARGLITDGQMFDIASKAVGNG